METLPKAPTTPNRCSSRPTTGSPILEAPAFRPTGRFLAVRLRCGSTTWRAHLLPGRPIPSLTWSTRLKGSITCWGLNDRGQTDAPEGAFKAVSAGVNHSCGVRADGSIACWGLNSFDQSDAPAGTFKAVAAGFLHSCGVRTDGTAICWGYNNWGQTEAPVGRFEAVSSGWAHNCGVRADGTVTCWGNNNWKQ